MYSLRLTATRIARLVAGNDEREDGDPDRVITIHHTDDDRDPIPAFCDDDTVTNDERMLHPRSLLNPAAPIAELDLDERGEPTEDAEAVVEDHIKRFVQADDDIVYRVQVESHPGQ